MKSTTGKKALFIVLGLINVGLGLFFIVDKSLYKVWQWDPNLITSFSVGLGCLVWSFIVRRESMVVEAPSKEISLIDNMFEISALLQRFSLKVKYSDLCEAHLQGNVLVLTKIDGKIIEIEIDLSESALPVTRN